MPVRAFAVLVAAAVLLPAAPARGAWSPPVDGPVSRGFAFHGSPFAAGRHRGADFTAPSGTGVRAACTGEVVDAERIGSSGGVVTVRCGRWRVSHLPLARIDVRQGERIAEGTEIGTAARSSHHAGLHLGVRREGERFGYVDPLRFLANGRPTMPVRGPRPPDRPRSPRRPRAPAPTSPPALARAAEPKPVRSMPPSASHRPTVGTPVAPWPAWVGLGVLALAAAGTGSNPLLRARRRRARGRAAPARGRMGA